MASSFGYADDYCEFIFNAAVSDGKAERRYEDSPIIDYETFKHGVEFLRKKKILYPSDQDFLKDYTARWTRKNRIKKGVLTASIGMRVKLGRKAVRHIHLELFVPNASTHDDIREIAIHAFRSDDTPHYQRDSWPFEYLGGGGLVINKERNSLDVAYKAFDRMTYRTRYDGTLTFGPSDMQNIYTLPEI